MFTSLEFPKTRLTSSLVRPVLGFFYFSGLAGFRGMVFFESFRVVFVCPRGLALRLFFGFTWANNCGLLGGGRPEFSTVRYSPRLICCLSGPWIFLFFFFPQNDFFVL